MAPRLSSFLSSFRRPSIRTEQREIFLLFFAAKWFFFNLALCFLLFFSFFFLLWFSFSIWRTSKTILMHDGLKLYAIETFHWHWLSCVWQRISMPCSECVSEESLSMLDRMELDEDGGARRAWWRYIEHGGARRAWWSWASRAEIGEEGRIR